MMKAVRVTKKKAQQVLKKLKKQELYDSSYEIKKEERHIIIPVKRPVKGFKVIDAKLKKKGRAERSIVSALEGKLTAKELGLVPRSFDVIGDIAIIDIKKGLRKEKLVAKALLKLNKNVKVVAKKTGIHKGRFRTQSLKVIAGDKRKTTVYRENNVKLMLNAETCYFSPRLSTERKRIAGLVKPGESILVMFSGVAPYPVVIAKNTKAAEVYGVELNPAAHKFAEKNVKLNKANHVFLFCGDVKEVVPKLEKKFDRILMPLPKGAEDYLDTAVAAARENAVIHFYDFVEEKEFPKASIKKVKKKYPKARILKSVKCGQYSPRKYRVCVDFKV